MSMFRGFKLDRHYFDQKFSTLEQNMRLIMATQFDTLTDDVTALLAAANAQQTAVTQAVTDLQAVIAALKALPPTTPDISAQIAAIEGVTTQLTAEAGAATAADPGAPVPPPPSA